MQISKTTKIKVLNAFKINQKNEEHIININKFTNLAYIGTANAIFR
jgi:hypothetical protein